MRTRLVAGALVLALFARGLWAATDTAGGVAHGPVISRSYFGLHIHRADTTTAWPRVPFGSWRLWDAHASWPHLEPELSKWDFRRLDRYVEMAQAKGVEILLPLGLSPTWASARPQEASAYNTPGWAAEPRNLATWREYVRTVAARYKGRIRQYEIWNEPNLTRFFTGSPEAMRTLTCEAYRTIKEVDPAARVVSPSATEKEKGIAWLRSFLAAGGGRCVDIVGFHFYVYAHEAPERLGGLARDLRALMEQYGLSGRELWNTETGWYFANRRVPNASRYRVLDEELSAGYLARALIVAADAGVSRFYWYAWDNATMGGLIEPDSGDIKPAATAYAAVFGWLVGGRLEGCQQAESVWECRLLDADARPARILWSTAGAHPWNLPAEFDITTIERVDGRSAARKGGAQGREIVLDELPVLVRGGPQVRGVRAGAR